MIRLLFLRFGLHEAIFLKSSGIVYTIPLTVKEEKMRQVVASIEGEYQRYKALGEGAFNQLNETDLVRPAPGEGNSVTTLVWHIAGNLASRFSDFLTSDGEKPWRDRESEFARRAITRAELVRKWETGWQALSGTLQTLSDEDLARTVTIRGVPLSVTEALHRSLTHASYHVGQIVFLAKSILGPDWKYLSIPPGQSGEYNKAPDREKPPSSFAR